MNEKQNNPLIEWAKATIKNTELELTKVLFDAFLSRSRSFDIFSSWFLLISGAIFTLLVSNLDAIRNIVDSFALTHFLFLMLASAIFGVIAKYYSIMIEIICDISKAIEKDFPPILNEFERKKEKIEEQAKQNKENLVVEVDLKEAIRPFIGQFPKILHNYYWKAFEEGKKDPLINHKKATKYVLKHAFYATLQILFFIIALLIFVGNVNL